MIMKAFFLNHKDFTSKKGNDCHVLTVCDSSGEVGQLFHDESVSVPDCALFAPLEIELEVSVLGRFVKKTVLSVREVKK